MADAPLDTSEHLLKGALAVAVNGVPIFNVLNNRSEMLFNWRIRQLGRTFWSR